MSAPRVAGGMSDTALISSHIFEPREITPASIM
jgi:hypothetical protein